MRTFVLVTLALVCFVGLSTASIAGIHDVARRFNEKAGIAARQAKDTVTVTVTSFAKSCSAATAQPATSPEASESANTPVVIVPGTQSTTATYNVPVGGATITPGASAVSPMQSTGKASPSGAAPAVPIPASANATSGAQAPAPVGTHSTLAPATAANATSTATESASTTESKTTSTTESPTSETATAAPSTSSTIVPASSNTANKSFNGVLMTVMAALAGAVALLN